MLLGKTVTAMASNGRVEKAVMDVSDLEPLKNAVTFTMDTLGSIDNLICNAGIAGPTLKVREYHPDEWQQVIDINLTGVFNYLQVVSPVIIK